LICSEYQDSGHFSLEKIFAPHPAGKRYIPANSGGKSCRVRAGNNRKFEIFRFPLAILS
jgi:hypothetical protein